jgi:uncharacterized DUF497 family protein
MIYEWDEAKRTANLKKHGLDFLDADLVMESEYVRIVNDSRPGEPRKLAFAYVFEALVVLRVVFVDREQRCRVISFRPANRKERSDYYAWLEDDFPDQ